METKTAGKTARATQMTEGAVWLNLLRFALPLMVGNLFQQLYNTVDSVIVGNFVGKEALAAVGSVDPIINTFIGFFMGMSTGAGVVISQYYGAKDEERVIRAVHTTIALTAVLSVFCTVCSLWLLPTFLRMLGTPDDVYGEAETYLRIYFMGVTGLLFYNMGSGILRAVGDSRRPLYFLIFSALLNTVLDILFVAGFHWGVAGAAYATILSQALSAVLVLTVLTLEKQMYRIRWNRLGVDPTSLGQIVRIGLPSALQMMVTAFSNVFIQAYINHFGSAAMAGWSSYQKIDKLCILPIQSVGLSATTFVGQNLGARKLERAKEGVRVALRLALTVTLILIIPLWIFAADLVGMFNRDPEVLHYGQMFLRMQMPFFLMLCFNQVYSNALQGAGNTKVPVVIMMSSFILFRQVYLFIASRLTDSVIPVALGYPAGWAVCSLVMTAYYHSVKLEKYSLIEM